jgi:hypothetical protein
LPTPQVADKVSEAYVECADTTRDEYLYYILVKHPGEQPAASSAASGCFWLRLAAPGSF